MKKHARSILFGSGIAAISLTLAGSIQRNTADYLVRMALDRNAPAFPSRVQRRLSAHCIDAGTLLKIQHAGKHLADIPHPVIRIKSRDGTPLLAHWMPVPHPRRILIAMHGWRSAWNHDFGMVADFFRRSSCSVLYVEQRGQGGSGGNYMGFGLTERYDCLDWIHWVNQETGGKYPVYLSGISMGASTVLMAAGLPMPHNVRGIIADCGYTSIEEIWKHVARKAHFSYAAYRKSVEALAQKKLSVSVHAASCPEALRSCHVPVLFIHGTDDHFVPIEMTYKNFKACSAPKKLFVVPGAEHGMSYLVDTQGYQNTVRRFWSECEP